MRASFLETRLKAVWHWLPLAAEKSQEDVEYVHQLRITTRRATEALRVFCNLMPKATCENLHTRLRKIRLAADEARNWDVLASLFSHNTADADNGIGGSILEQIRVRRNEVQTPIVEIYQELLAETFNEQMDTLVEEIRAKRGRKAKRRFGRRARRYLKTPLRKFFKTFDTDLSTDKALHKLRIRTKKLRYTMEIIAVAFESPFRKRLYPRISLLQELMGAINDHAIAEALFRDWRLQSRDMEQQPFLEGFLCRIKGPS